MKRWEIAAIVTVVLIGAFLRLYQLPQYLTFLGDEGRDAIVMRDIMLARHFPLIGPGTSVGNMYLGPLYYYLIAPSLTLSNFSPVGPAAAVAGIGLATIALLWWVGRTWYGGKISLVIAFLYAISPTVITYSRSSWNPNVMPFFSLLTVFSLWQVWSGQRWRWLVVSSVSLAFALNSHYLGLLLVPVFGLFVFLSYLRSGQIRSSASKWLILSFVTFLLLMSPLFFFDLRHNGQNFSAVKTFFSQRQTTVNIKAYKALPNLWPITRELVTTLITAKQPVPGQVVAFAFVGFSLLLLIKRAPRSLYLLSWLVTGLIGLGLYKQHIYDHYFGFLFPLVFLLLGLILRQIAFSKIARIVAAGVLSLLIFINLRSSPLNFPPNNQLARTQEVAEFILQKSSGQPFNLALLATSNYDASYRYFLELKSAQLRTLHQQVTGQLFVICEQTSCQPIGHPLWEIAAYGWAKIDTQWTFPWGVTLYRLIPNPQGRPV